MPSLSPVYSRRRLLSVSRRAQPNPPVAGEAAPPARGGVRRPRMLLVVQLAPRWALGAPPRSARHLVRERSAIDARRVGSDDGRRAWGWGQGWGGVRARV